MVNILCIIFAYNKIRSCGNNLCETYVNFMKYNFNSLDFPDQTRHLHQNCEPYFYVTNTK